MNKERNLPEKKELLDLNGIKFVLKAHSYKNPLFKKQIWVGHIEKNTVEWLNAEIEEAFLPYRLEKSRLKNAIIRRMAREPSCDIGRIRDAVSRFEGATLEGLKKVHLELVGY